MLGHEGQVCMKLPRCIHNMSGVGLDEGGFHQRLNALFAKDRRFEEVTVENAEAFNEALDAARKIGELDDFLVDARGLLLRAYRESIREPRVLALVGALVRDEFDRISTSSHP